MVTNSSSEKKWEAFIFHMTALIVLLTAFWSVVQKLLLRWDTGDNSYTYAVIPIFIYLCWDIRDKFRFNELSWNFWGLLPAFFSVFLIFAGEIGSVESLTYLGLWGCITSYAITIYGFRTKHLFFPFLMLVFIVPLPEFINNLLTFKLKLLASSISVEMFRLAGLSVFLEGNVIDMGIEKLQVVDACSGLRYFMSLIVISLLVGYLFTKGWWRRIIILLLVIPLSSFVNGLRIFVMGMLINNGMKEYTEGVYHDLNGVIVFMVAGALLVGAAFILNKIGPSPVANGIDDPGGRETNKTLPIIITGVFCLLFAGGAYAYRSIPTSATHPERATFEAFPMQLGKWQGDRIVLDEKLVEEGLWSDDYVNASYRKEGGSNSIYLLIPFYAWQGTRHTVHAPQACLLGGGYSIEQEQIHRVQVTPDRAIEIKALLLAKGDQKMLATHIFLQRGRVLTSPWTNKFYLMYDSMTKRRTDGALVRVELVLTPNQSLEDGLSMIDDFYQQLWPLLPKYVPF